MIWFTQFAIESGCIKNDMNEREFKLLVREYFQWRSKIAYAGLHADLKWFDRKNALEKRILTELSRFTQQEQEELPFKD